MTESIHKIIEELPERKVDSQKFNEVFQVDGIPLWYFLEPIMRTSYIPKPFRGLAEIERDIKENKTSPSSMSLKLSLLRKALAMNEKIKLWITRAKRKKAKRIGKMDIMFLVYTNQIFKTEKGSEFLGFGGVVKDLKKRGVKPLALVCDPFSKNSLFGLKRFDDSLYAHVDSEIIKESERLSRELVKRWRKVNKKKLFTFQGKNYWKFLKNEMNFLFSREMLAILIKYYLTFKKIIKKHDLKLLYLTGFIGIYESAILGAADKLNKKIVYSPHGYGSYVAPQYLRKEFYKNFLFAASGAEEKRKLLRLGINPRSIFVTGSPFFDKIAEYRNKKIRKTGKKTITLLTNKFVEDGYMGKSEYFEFIRDIMAQIDKIDYPKKIIIKMHPAEKYKTEYERIIKSLGIKDAMTTKVADKDGLYSILSSSDLLVSFGIASTVDVEGLMVGKDVIVVKGLAKKLVPAEYERVLKRAKPQSDWTALINRIFSDKTVRETLRKRREKYVRECFFKIDGKAHKRAADFIYKYVKSQKLK